MQPESNLDKVGYRVRLARQRRGLTQAELSELVDCSNNHMSHIESGQTKASLCRLFGANTGVYSPHQRAVAGDYRLC